MAFKNKNRMVAKPHLLIDAGPGCGKTTTMLSLFGILLGGKHPKWKPTNEQADIWAALEGESGKIGFFAFNKAIAEEIAAKVPAGIDARTFHSYGNQLLRENGYKFKMSSHNTGFQVSSQLGYDKGERMSREHFLMSLIVEKIVSVVKNNLLEPTRDNIVQAIIESEADVNGNMEQVIELVAGCIAKDMEIKPGVFTFITFDDMIWLPVVLGLEPNSKFSLLVSDESQDLNPAQHALTLSAADRFVIIGDPRQAIYGFRGADAKSMNTIREKLENTKRGCCVLPLQVSFRLPKSGVANVQAYAPDLKCLPNAPKGTIQTIRDVDIEQHLKPGCLVVSRVNQNIFSLGFKLMRKKMPVQIQGREFAEQLIKILEKECEATDNQQSMLDSIRGYDNRETERLMRKQFPEKQLATHAEKIACLYNLIADCKTCAEAVQSIKDLYVDQPREKIILLSTGHRAKGLEANDVFILHPHLMPHPMAKTPDEVTQELNLKFVAETRHKKNLFYVTLTEDEDSQDEGVYNRDGLSDMLADMRPRE